MALRHEHYDWEVVARWIRVGKLFESLEIVFEIASLK
jgi:hypothetical protein